MESLFKTQIKTIQPKKFKSSCLLCKNLFHTEDTQIYNNEYSVCIDCSKTNNTENIIKICIEKTDEIHFKGTAYKEYSENCNSDLKTMMKKKFMTEKNPFKGQILISPN